VNTQLHPNAIYYFMLRSAAALAVVGIATAILLCGDRLTGTVNGRYTVWTISPGFRLRVSAIYVAVAAAMFLYTRTLVQSYLIVSRFAPRVSACGTAC
jgi:hypothetical protein